MKIVSQKRGFTLIELLVVIAIIGLLASIVMINLNTARNKAKDAAIKGALSEVRAAAAMEYDNVIPNSYEGVCSDVDFTLSDSGDFLRLETNIRANNGSTAVTCYDTAGTFCTQSVLNGGGNWCVDHKGFSGTPVAACAAGNIECD